MAAHTQPRGAAAGMFLPLSLLLLVLVACCPGASSAARAAAAQGSPQPLRGASRADRGSSLPPALASLEARFSAFEARYGKLYTSEDERSERKRVFAARLEMIDAHNAAAAAGGPGAPTWTLRANHLADRRPEELARRLMASQDDCSAAMHPGSGSHDVHAAGRGDALSSPAGPAAGPQEQDWRAKGVIGPIVDQGDCGSCYAFAAAAALEAAAALQTGAVRSLSQQQILDCSSDGYGNMGCDGGLPSNSFLYGAAMGGIATAADYPYTGAVGNCRYFGPQGLTEGRSDPASLDARGAASAGTPATVAGASARAAGVPAPLPAAFPATSVNLTRDDEAALLDALHSVGPVAVSIQVLDDFTFYASGVYNNANCSSAPGDINHAVLAVAFYRGRAAGGGPDHLVIKNSWGIDWGVDGYGAIALGHNRCGLATCASYPVMEPLPLF